MEIIAYGKAASDVALALLKVASRVISSTDWIQEEKRRKFLFFS